jgi:hypothetical protein
VRQLLLLALALAAVAAVQAQDPRLEGRLDPATRASVKSLLDSARAAGLPTEPIVDKVLEGMTKRASPDRIVAAVRTLATDLGAARVALGPAASDEDVVSGASALRAGASAETLARIKGVRGKAGLSVPLAVLSDLVARGVPVDTAASVIVHLAQGGASDADYTGLERGVARDIGAGAPPGAAAAIRARIVTTEAPGASNGPPPGVPGKGPREPQKAPNRP